MATDFMRHIVDSYLNKALTLLALVFVAAILVFGLGDRSPRTAHVPLSGETAGSTHLR
jgi:hypothetical protein